MLFVYNLYRLLSVIVLAIAYILNRELITLDFFIMISVFLIYALIVLIITKTKWFNFEALVLVTGTVDVLTVILLINKITIINSALGVLLVVYIALLSILVPGRLAIFFSALASFMLLALSILRYTETYSGNYDHIYTSGIYGAGFFATALTAWYLAHWIKSNELLALQSARELANIHKLNEYIVERLHFGVIYIDRLDNIQVINASALKVFNKSVKPSSLALLSNSLYQKYLKFKSSMHKIDVEYSAQTTLEDKNVKVRFYSAPSSDLASEVLIIINDLEEINQQAQQMKLASLGFFSASIAHELRNPLGSISHAGQLLLEEDITSKDKIRLKELILNNCERMNKIIQNVLSMSKSRKATLEKINLVKFLKKFSNDYCEINKCKIKLLNFKKAAYVLFDQSQLEQVLVIICDNALEHGNSLNKFKITMEIDKTANSYVLRIADYGKGIPKDERKFIFDPFYSTTASGNGMGLFLAKDLCRNNQALLELEDSEVGARFAIYFHSSNEVLL